MEVKLLRANISDAKEIHAMQVEAFKELLEKYQDFDTNPGSESVEKVEARLKQDFTFYYFIILSVSDSKKLELFVLLTKRKPEKTREFPQYLYCRNFRVRALRRKQSGCVKKYMETETGSWIQFCRNRGTVICMRKWGIGRQVKQKSLTKNLHWYFIKNRSENGIMVFYFKLL